jgi:hypothetical protein
MKTLVYTISDFKDGAIDCIRMMKNSIIGNNFDFVIISNKKIDCEYEIIIDETIDNYIGFLKYSAKVPKGYDQYIYFDSDILFFAPISDFCSNQEFSIVFENLKMNSQCSAGKFWFKYPYDSSDEYFHNIKNIYGINAGSFAFKNISFLSNVRSFFEKFKSNDIVSNAILEQSSFNYALCIQNNFDFSKCFDFTSKAVIHAKPNSFNINKKLYHFTGFSNTMINKKEMMKKFIYENF